MARATYVDKAEVVATLRSRGLNGRADWVDRQLPEAIDTIKNASLLQTLGIDAAAMPSGVRPDDDAGRDLAAERALN
jgi:hypothetical protein